MEKLSIEAVCSSVNGQLLQKGQAACITGVCIDSRKVKADYLYIPIIGEKQDGHIFIPGAVEKGAAAVLTMQSNTTVPPEMTVILVKDTVRALQDLAKAYRRQFDIPVIAVTGSSGKTTTKDILAAVLSRKFRTMKTQGNFNNPLGVPQTIFQLDRGHEAAVVETGMGKMGDIAETIEAILPHYAVMTNIGKAHLEFLGTQENILKAKMEVFATMGAGDYAVLNGDDPWLDRIQDGPYNIIRVGIDADDGHLDLKGKLLHSDAQGIDFEAAGERYHFRFPGKHNVYNCLSAIFIGKDLGLTTEEIRQGFDDFVPSGNRMHVDRISGITYIDDSYNANPDAMRAALNVLADMSSGKGKRIAVLGDMLEMGENAEKLHYDTGCYAGEKADVLIAVGTLAKVYLQGAKEAFGGMETFYCGSVDQAEAILREVAEEGDTVLIKASNGVGLKEIMKNIKGE